MNWNQYFTLKEKQKKHFWIFFIIFFFFNLFYIKGLILNGPEPLCEEINISCPDLQINFSIEITVNSSIGNNTNSSDTNLTNQTEASPKGYLEDIWLNCDTDCNSISIRDSIRLWKYRITYTPIFILTDIIIAFILSLILKIYAIFKIEHKKEESEEPKEGDEKKES